MSRFNKSPRNVNVTVPTEGEWRGEPSLSLPTDNPAFPVTMCLPKWRIIEKHWESHVKPFLAKHPQRDTSDDTAAVLAKVMGISLDDARARIAAAK